MAFSLPPAEAMSEQDCPDAETDEAEGEEEEGDDRDKDEDNEKSGESGLPEFWEAESATADSST